MTVLAVVQGLTEFLPVSSSGHLVLAKTLLGFEAASGLGVELLLHAGTLVAVLLYYRKTIAETVIGLFSKDAAAWKFAAAILISMIPAVILGLLFEDELEQLTESPAVVCALLTVTGTVLLLTRILGSDRGKDVSMKGALLIGCAQAAAMLPGVSRSGSTIAMARLLGVASDKAAAFSFLMVVPVILGGNLLHLIKALGDPAESAFAGLTPTLSLLGFVVSAAVGYASVAWMVRLLGRHSFWKFGFYCIAVGLIGLAWLIF